MNNYYGRRHVSESLLTLSGKIHPAYCVGRKSEKLNNKTDEIFSQAFFASCSTEELNLLWDFAEKEARNGELLISFSVKDGDTVRSLSTEEMKSFIFSSTRWEIHPLSLTEDELREVSQAMCSVFFYA